MHFNTFDNFRRELIPQGETGGLIIFEDHPNYWDAWGALHGTFIFVRYAYSWTAFHGSDVEIHHLEKAQQLKFENVKIVASGPLRATVEAEVKYGKSTIRVTVSAPRDSLTPR
jgi:alpha-mannosidase